MCSISRPSTQDKKFVICVLWGREDKIGSGGGEAMVMGRGSAMTTGDLRVTLGTSYPQGSPNLAIASKPGQARWVSVSAQVPVVSIELTTKGQKVWPMNVLGCLLKWVLYSSPEADLPGVILQWPLRDKGHSFYHMVLKNNSKSS